MAEKGNLEKIIRSLMQVPFSDERLTSIFYARYRIDVGQKKAQEIVRRMNANYGHQPENIERIISCVDEKFSSGEWPKR